jgi:flavin-dependent dehydrogenase
MVGDAAGFFDPFTGEGIHRAILGGRIAAAAALEAVNQGQSAAQIEAYHRARHAAFRQKEMVTALVQAFVRIPGLLDYALPRLESRPLAGGLLASVLGDVADAGQFLRPRPLWDAVRP